MIILVRRAGHGKDIRTLALDNELSVKAKIEAVAFFVEYDDFLLLSYRHANMKLLADCLECLIIN
jgi:uncharacterized protein YneR